MAEYLKSSLAFWSFVNCPLWGARKASDQHYNMDDNAQRGGDVFFGYSTGA